jgi:hypothetical protein
MQAIAYVTIHADVCGFRERRGKDVGGVPSPSDARTTLLIIPACQEEAKVVDPWIVNIARMRHT